MADQALINRWIDALCSGQYKQTTGVLHDPRGFCCLGVLCDITEGMGRWAGSAPEGNYRWFVPNGAKYGCHLPCDIRLRVGLSLEQEGTLINMNDARTSFMDIANYIEQIAKNPEGLA